ncbi:MAG: hypothetical protein ACTSYH_10780 [Candidatus Heimdallarchaeaceae archaeon]
MSAKVFFASVFVSLVIMAPVAFFVLPLFYPSMKDETGVIQSVYEEFDDVAYIEDDTVIYELINQTELVISTQGHSKLAILFTMQSVISISSTMVGALSFEVALVVEGIGNKTLKQMVYQQVPFGSYREIPTAVTINYVTGKLAAGNYTIGVYWKSIYPKADINYLIGYTVPNFAFPRSIWVQEIIA